MSNIVSFKSINKLAIPAIISGIAEPILSATDTAVVGNIAIFGTESLAAVGIVGSFLSMITWILAQTSPVISAIISQNLGSGNFNNIKTFPIQAITFNLVLSFAILLLTIPFIEEIFQLFQAKGNVLQYCVSYYSIRVWGFPFTLFVFAIFGIFRGLQNTFWPMIVALIGVLINIILDFALVYGIEGYIKPMNIEGAAWASLISQVLMSIISLLLLLKKTDISLILNKNWHPEMNRFLAMSIDLFVRTLALQTTIILAVREATVMGTNYVAAHTIAMQLWLFSSFFLDGYAVAGNVFGGKLFGAKDYQNLVILSKRVCLYGIIVACILGGGALLFPKNIGSIFTKDNEVLVIFLSFFYLVILVLPINAIAFVLDGIFKGMGETRFLKNILLISTFLGFVPILYISHILNLGLHGIWIAITIWMLIRASLLVIKFRNKYFKLAVKQS